MTLLADYAQLGSAFGDVDRHRHAVTSHANFSNIYS
jgi:hypothetical protein